MPPGEYVPAPQVEHADCPDEGWYCPGGHEVHPAVPPGENVPASQVEQELVVPPNEYSPAEHAKHVSTTKY